MNELIKFWMDIYLPILWEAPFLVYSGNFLGNFRALFLSTSSNEPLNIELIYLLIWISRFVFEFNNILNWSSIKHYWIEYWMNHFLAKFKHWIESDGVSATTTIYDSIQFKISLNKKNSTDSIQKIIQFNSQGIINTGRMGKVPKKCPK